MPSTLLENKIKEIATIDGLNPIALAGVVIGNRAFGDGFGDGAEVFYVASNTQAEQWEIGRGIYDDDLQQISRDFVYNSSNANALVPFTAGTIVVYNDVPIQFFSYLPTAFHVPRGDENGQINSGWLPTGFGTGNVTGPASSTSDAVAVFDNTTGKLLRNSEVIIHESANDKLQTNATFMAWQTNTDGSTVTLDLNLSDKHTVIYGGNRTLVVNNVSVGQRISLLRTQDGTGNRVETWFGNISWDNNLAPVQDPTAVGWDLVVLDCVSIGFYDIPNWVEVSRTSSAPRKGITVVADAATITFDLRVSPKQQVTLGGNRTLELTTNSSYVGQTFALHIVQDGSGNRTVTFGTSFGSIDWSATNGSQPTLPATGSTWFCFLCTATNTYACVGVSGAIAEYVNDDPYDSSWNAVGNVAPSKNAVYDKFETLGTSSTLNTDTDGTLAANSDTLIATQKAVKTYVDTSVVGLLDYKGAIDASTNPNYPAASKGDTYVISVAGKIGGASGPDVQAGDSIICKADAVSGNHATVGSSWNIIQGNVTVLPSLNGGTGVANTGTLTNASDTTITGGGTFALGGFTFTVPATGTAALLAMANVFTAKQTIRLTTNQFEVGYDVSNYYTATVSSTGAVTFDATGSAPSFTFSGDVGVGVTPDNRLDIYKLSTGVTTGEVCTASELDITMSAAGTTDITPLATILRFRGSVNQTDAVKGASGFLVSAFCYNTATVTNFSGWRNDTRNLSTGTITNAQGIWLFDILNSGGGAITTAAGIRINDITTGTNNYGISTAVTSGTNKYNIYASGTAANYFNGSIQTHTGTALGKIESRATSGAQLVGSYDASNYWTATTSSVGLTTFDAIGTGAGFLFSDPVGIGSANGNSNLFRVETTLVSSNASQYGCFIAPTGSSSATTEINGIYVRPTTTAAVYTSSTVRGIYVGTNTAGAGSTITVNVGVDVQALTAGGTNNIAYRGLVASAATGGYNCYMSGSAPNYFAGNVSIGLAVARTILDIAGVATSVNFTVGTDPTANLVIQNNESAISTGPNLVFSSYYNSTNTVALASIKAERLVDTGSSSAAGDADLVFGTTATLVLAERARLTTTGRLGIGTGSTVSARLHTISTTEQFRVGYDASNYYTTTVSSAGAVTFDATGASASFRFSDNIGIGTVTFGTNATNTLALFSGVVPTTSPADTVQLFSQDVSAGNCTIGIRAEVAVVTESVTSDRTLQMYYNGTLYKFCLKA